MRNDVIRIGDKVDFFSNLYYQRTNNSDNNPQREKMKRILRKAIMRELTDRQRDCLTLRYLQRMKVKDIAVQLELSESTVSRHITAAERKLKHIAAYYE